MTPEFFQTGAQGGAAEDFEFKVNPLRGGDVEMAQVSSSELEAVAVSVAVVAEGDVSEAPTRGTRTPGRGTIMIDGHEWSVKAPGRRSSFAAAVLRGSQRAGAGVGMSADAASLGLEDVAGGGGQGTGAGPQPMRRTKSWRPSGSAGDFDSGAFNAAAGAITAKELRSGI